MAEELHLLHVMVVSLRDMMSKILVPSTLQGNALFLVLISSAVHSNSKTQTLQMPRKTFILWWIVPSMSCETIATGHLFPI